MLQTSQLVPVATTARQEPRHERKSSLMTIICLSTLNSEWVAGGRSPSGLTPYSKPRIPIRSNCHARRLERPRRTGRLTIPRRRCFERDEGTDDLNVREDRSTTPAAVTCRESPRPSPVRLCVAWGTASPASDLGLAIGVVIAPFQAPAHGRASGEARRVDRGPNHPFVIGVRAVMVTSSRTPRESSERAVLSRTRSWL
jgi:hypothetical protein